MKAKMTVKEIAKMAGVSPTAVSFVLNNKEGVSEKTRQRVENIIKATNYTPDKNARRLYFKKSFNICLAITKKSSPFADLFYLDVLKGVLQRGMEHGYNVMISEFPEQFPQDRAFSSSIAGGDTDGVIFFQDTPEQLLRYFDELEIPYVLVDTHSQAGRHITVDTDCELSTFVATEKLIENGHRKIALLCSSFLPEFYLQVSSGFMRAVAGHGLSVSPSYLIRDAYNEKSAYELMKKFLKENRDDLPTAFFCAGDIYAIAAMNAAMEMGYRVPDDFSFIAMDDIIISQYVRPQLTTVTYDKCAMGAQAIDLLVDLINHKPAHSVVIKSDRIIERESIRRLV